MATVTALSSGSQPEHRGLSFWMDRVIKELENASSSLDAGPVHDLRVAIRRCRSVAAVMEEVDPDPAWPAMRKAARKLFRELGALRDAQVMDEWVKKLAPESDPFRTHLRAAFESKEPGLRENTRRVAAKFDQKSWKRLERTLRLRSRLVPTGSLAAECLTLERFESARELHAKALRTEKPKAWHALRIGLKRFRYTVESLLPEHYANWGDNLKRLQDMLGEIHDLDVLTEAVKKSEFHETEGSLKLWQEIIERERHERTETYRQLTLGKTSLWNIWRSGLPTNGRVEAAALARLRATARAVDPHVRRTSQISRIAVALFDAFKRADSTPAFSDATLHRVLLAASLAWRWRRGCRQVASKNRPQIPSWPQHSSRVEQRRLGAARSRDPLPSRGRTPRERRSFFQAFGGPAEQCPRSGRRIALRARTSQVRCVVWRRAPHREIHRRSSSACSRPRR